MSLPSRQSRLGIDDLYLLVAIGDSGSLSGAARRLGCNHASAWKRLGRIEKRLSVRLFDRQRTGYVVTPAGEEAITGARRILESVDGLERQLAGRDVRPAGTVRLTTTETLIELMMPAVAQLRKSHSNVLVELSATNTFLTLTKREADIALRPAPEPPEGLVARKVSGVATAVYAAAGDARQLGPNPTCEWITPDDSLAHLGSARWIKRNVPAERVVLYCSSLNAMAAAAIAGVGAAPLPCFMADANPVLVRITPPIVEMGTNLWLLTHPDLRRTARVRVVSDAVYDTFVRLRPLLAGEHGTNKKR